jgi:hypothetical protein
MLEEGQGKSIRARPVYERPQAIHNGAPMQSAWKPRHGNHGMETTA